MWGFVSKEDKKALQKVRENKDKDVETWKYVTGRESVIMLLCMLLAGLSIIVLQYAKVVSWETIFFVVICLVVAVICYIGMIRVITELTRENKKESEK